MLTSRRLHPSLVADAQVRLELLEPLPTSITLDQGVKVSLTLGTYRASFSCTFRDV